MKTYYVTVDEDIDPTNLNEVLWAMCTRVDPATSVDIIHDAWTADLDPRVSPDRREAGDLTVGRMLINACRPFTWRDQFPKSNVFSAEERRIVENKWRDLLEGTTKNGRRRKRCDGRSLVRNLIDSLSSVATSGCAAFFLRSNLHLANSYTLPLWSYRNFASNSVVS